jgi:hypothetical protein
VNNNNDNKFISQVAMLTQECAQPNNAIDQTSKEKANMK